ncbi:hypothetical protein [Burkholderia diffusa]|uniref:hypothetical protein n=1 Tax=Burkholderia diffusa TaxID=488732 RepID=UPI001E472845|nr:hypothetical protein [Burkholderia diffusa]
MHGRTPFSRRAIDQGDSPNASGARRNLRATMKDGGGRFLEYGSFITNRIANYPANEAAIAPGFGVDDYKTPSDFSKAFHLIAFNFVSYNQKKFDTELSFLIPSDASNPTNCNPRNRSCSTHLVSAAPKFSPPTVASPVGACNIPMHSLGSCRPAARRRTESDEQDTETVALAIPPASGLQARPIRIAAQRLLYPAFQHFAPGRSPPSRSGERPRRVRAIRVSATDIGGARSAPPSTVVVRAVRCSTGGVIQNESGCRQETKTHPHRQARLRRSSGRFVRHDGRPCRTGRRLD